MRMWKSQRDKLDVFEKQAIELFFEEDTCVLISPIYMTDAMGQKQWCGAYNTIYMVGLRTIGGRSIDNVEVKLGKIDPDVLHVGELVLNPRGITKGSPSTFALNSGDTRYVEVIEWYSDFNEASIHSYENYHVQIRQLDTLLPVGKYIFTISATGRDVPRCERQFLVEVSEKSGLSFCIKEA